MTRKSRRTGRAGVLLHRAIEAIHRFAEAVQHVRTGGQSARKKAVRRAARPPRRCPECRQEVPHSPDYRDHLDHNHD